MKKPNTIQEAVIKGVSFAVVTSLIVFGAVFVMMVSDDLFSVDRLEKALTITGDYFSGIATLTAAYIAALLLNDWKIQHNKTTISKEALSLCVLLEEFLLEIEVYRDSVKNDRQYNHIFTKSYTTIFDKKRNLSKVLRQLKLLQNSYIVKVKIFIKLLPDNSDTHTLKSIGAYDARACFNRYYKFVQESYINQNGKKVDEELILKTRKLKDDLDSEIEIIQKNLKEYIILKTEDSQV